jgi:GAF domain-containing protein
VPSQDHADDGRGLPSADDDGSAAGLDDLAVRLSRSARDMQREDDPATTLAAVVTAAVQLVPGADEGSITAVTGRRHVTNEAASGDLPRRVDALQQETGEGPCLDSAYEQETVRVDDMSSEQRWPTFARRAAEAGAGSMLSLQLFVSGDNLGALNLYGGRGAFDDESEHVGLLFAAHAAIAYAAARREAQLLRAVGTRELIGQAQGILMERHRIPASEAFARLVVASQHRNVKLRQIAEALIETGVTPGATGR